MGVTAMVTIKEAAEILGLSYLQTRIYLGDPDDFTLSKSGHQVHLHEMDKVLRIKERRQGIFEQRVANKGKQKCYHCGDKVDVTDLTSGICSKCYAYKVVKNFACHGDYIHGAVDDDRLNKILDAVNRLKESINPQSVSQL
jgi:hypothetical protein